MPITFVSHYTLRDIPWNVLLAKCIRPWCADQEKQCKHSLTERTRSFLRADGLYNKQQYEFSESIFHSLLQDACSEEVPLDFLGMDRSFHQPDGSVIDMRLMANRLPEGNIVADLYITLDLASRNRVKGTHLSLHHQMQEFATESGEMAPPRIHFGEVPPSVYLKTTRGALWNQIQRHENKPRIRTQVIEKDGEENSAPENPEKECSQKEQSVKQQSEVKNSTTESFKLEQSLTEHSSGNYSPDEYSKLQERIKQLEESLEEASSENTALSEQLEESQRMIRTLGNEKKAQRKTIKELQDKNDRLKKRMKQADKRANMNADEKFTKFCEDFDKENEELQLACRSAKAECEDLKQKLRDAEGKVVSLKGRLAKVSSGQTSGLLNAPNENEKFENEFGIAIFSALHKAIEKTPSKSNSYGNRPIDAWKAIIQANPDMECAYQNYKDTKDQLMDAMKSNDLERNFHLLTPLGMTYSIHTNNHWKLTFIDGDRRYKATHASTPSETASGPSNSAKDLKNAFLYPT